MGRRCFPPIIFGAEVSVALRHFVYTYFLYTGVTDLMSAALLIQCTKYPINTTTSIEISFQIFKERCYVFVCKGMSQSPAQNTFSKIFDSCKACRRKKFGSVSRMSYIRGQKTSSMSIANCTCGYEDRPPSMTDSLLHTVRKVGKGANLFHFYGMLYEELPALTYSMPNQ